MASPQTLEACGEHKLSIQEDNKANSLKLLNRAQWLRAAILGANDGLLSTTSLMLGVGAVKENQQSMVLSGLAGAVAGACSMAVGEFVSVSTQRDIERKTKKEMCEYNDKGDIKLNIACDNPTPVTLTASPALTPLRSLLFGKLMNDANQPLEKVSSAIISEKNSPLERESPVSFPSVNSPVMRVLKGDAKREKMEGEGEGRGEMTMETGTLPNPYKAAAASALAFLFGSLFPILPAILVARSTSIRIGLIIVVTSIALALFGGTGAYLGGSNSVRVSAVRVLIGGWVSMAVTYGLLKPLDRDRKGDDDSE